jgi:hypothetical protein
MQGFQQEIPSPLAPYSVPQQDLLRSFAAHYIWWKTADEALRYPARILAQVMNLGTYEDLGLLLKAFTVAELRAVLAQAEPGWFNERSWAFWQYRLGMTALDAPLPPLPARLFPG